MRFIVRLLDRARKDADDIYEWLSWRSESGADRWLAAFQEALDSLETNALRHGFAPESGEFIVEIRECFFKTSQGKRYRLLYTVDGDEVFAVSVRGPGQPPVSEQSVYG
jgi:plasmid stabilization system protein ParE